MYQLDLDSKSPKSKNEFYATREEIMEMARKEHKWKIDGLARYVLQKNNKSARRKFLEEFEAKHGEKITYELKDRIIELDKELRFGSAPANQSR